MKSQAPELDDEYGGKEVTREEVDDWIGGFDSEGDYEEEEEEEGMDSEGDEEGESEEEGEKQSLKTKNAEEAERLHRELLSADKNKSRTKQTYVNPAPSNVIHAWNHVWMCHEQNRHHGT